MKKQIQDIYDKVIEIAGDSKSASASAKSASDGVIRINGSIAIMVKDIEQNRIDNLKNDNEIKRVERENLDISKKLYEYLVEKKEEKEREITWWGNLKLNFISYLVTAGISSGGAWLLITLIDYFSKKS